jgi:hypothetical protein
MILQAISDGLLVSLHSIEVDVNDTLEALQGNKADIVFFVHQEATQDVNAQNTEARACFNAHDGADTLSKDGVARVLRSLSIGSYLGQDIRHLIGGL